MRGYTGSYLTYLTYGGCRVRVSIAVRHKHLVSISPPISFTQSSSVTFLSVSTWVSLFFPLPLWGIVKRWPVNQTIQVLLRIAPTLLKRLLYSSIQSGTVSRALVPWVRNILPFEGGSEYCAALVHNYHKITSLCVLRWADDQWPFRIIKRSIVYNSMIDTTKWECSGIILVLGHYFVGL